MTPRLPLEHARRLALHAQGLASPPPAGQSVSDVVARLGCLQLDPVGVVARSPLLVLRARLRGGSHDSHARALDRAAYGDRVLFDYWCHEASLCHVDDLPLHRWAMRTYVERLSPARAHRAHWLADNADFVEHLVDDLRARGPVRARELEDRSAAAWEWGHWTDEVSSRQTIARMLDLLWMTGPRGHRRAVRAGAPVGRVRALRARPRARAAGAGRGGPPRGAARRGHAGRGARAAHHRALHPPALSGPAGRAGAAGARRAAGARGCRRPARRVVGAAGGSGAGASRLEPGIAHAWRCRRSTT